MLTWGLSGVTKSINEHLRKFSFGQTYHLQIMQHTRMYQAKFCCKLHIVKCIEIMN